MIRGRSDMILHYQKNHQCTLEEAEALADERTQKLIAPRDCEYCGATGFETEKQYVIHKLRAHATRHRKFTKVLQTESSKVSIINEKFYLTISYFHEV